MAENIFKIKQINEYWNADNCSFKIERAIGWSVRDLAEYAEKLDVGDCNLA
jgi:hypothetical protein